ncbi:MAG TPA: protein kinase [Thermoanaerobaculia bacterium]|nr:protein kinase [Thermoanaerobaculia bacterium]
MSTSIPAPAPRQQLLLLAPAAGSTAAPYATILEAEGFDVLLANNFESAMVLVQNSSPSMILVMGSVLGDALREAFRKHAPAAEIRLVQSFRNLLEETTASPGETLDFAIRALLAADGVLAESRGIPRERASRILQLTEAAAVSLRFSRTDAAAARIIAALFGIPEASQFARTQVHGEPVKGAHDPTSDRRTLLSTFLEGLRCPVPIVSSSGDGGAGATATPMDLVEAAAEYVSELEGRSADPILALRRKAATGLLHPSAVEAIIGAVSKAGHSRRGKVLVVDGDGGARSLLALRLANEGYEVETAGDGRAALAIARSGSLSLIISETVLAGIDGYGLLDTLRREGAANVPFVFLSSHADAVSMNKGLLLGAADFLTKPINNEVLLTKIQKLLRENLAPADASARISLSDIQHGETARDYPTLSYDQLAPGVSILGRFLLLGDLGEGGMGKVFKARDERLDEEVVIKVMKDSLTGDARALEHFKREIRLARKISHPAVVRIFDFWEAGPLNFVTMEFLQGTDLSEELRRRGSFPVSVGTRLMIQFFEGLGAAHDLGVIHRDIKPHNVFLQTGGRLKILDFGIAQGLDPSGPDAATVTRTVTGTPDYMSPEQLLGQKLDGRTDLYSAGVMMYQLLTGELPFHGPDRTANISARVHSDPEAPSARNPKVTEDLDRFVLRLLARSRDLRYATAHDAAADLRLARPPV